jgi:CTP-dependent riboflavin kinase
MERMTGIIFSDLGQASSFMALDWVQDLLKQSLGYHPFPATLNVRPSTPADAQVWERMRSQSAGTPLPAAADKFCSAKLYRVEIQTPTGSGKVAAAILLPEVKDYPKDKIEIVAPVRLKDHLGVRDGDRLTLEFLN